MEYLLINDIILAFLGYLLGVGINITENLVKHKVKAFSWSKYFDTIKTIQLIMGFLATVGLLVGVPELLDDFGWFNYWNSFIALLLGMGNITIIKLIFGAFLNRLKNKLESTPLDNEKRP